MKDMSFALTDDQKALKTAVYDLCKQYTGEYWRELDAKREYPDAFINDLTKAGYLAVLIPQEYGGAGPGLMEGAALLEEEKPPGGDRRGALAPTVSTWIARAPRAPDEKKPGHAPRLA